MAISESDVIKSVKAYTFLSCQTSSESSSSANIEASLLYNDGSENQGNFSIFYADAIVQLNNDCIIRSIVMSDTQKIKAYAYLIQHYYETKSKDWNATDINLNNDLVKRPAGSSTSGWAAYKGLLSDVVRATSGAISTTIIKHNDETNYPENWRDIPEDAEVLDVV